MESSNCSICKNNENENDKNYKNDETNENDKNYKNDETNENDESDKCIHAICTDCLKIFYENNRNICPLCEKCIYELLWN
jgi:hypothetical protein